MGIIPGRRGSAPLIAPTCDTRLCHGPAKVSPGGALFLLGLGCGPGQRVGVCAGGREEAAAPAPLSLGWVAPPSQGGVSAGESPFPWSGHPRAILSPCSGGGSQVCPGLHAAGALECAGDEGAGRGLQAHTLLTLLSWSHQATVGPAGLCTLGDPAPLSLFRAGLSPRLPQGLRRVCVGREGECMCVLPGAPLLLALCPHVCVSP